MAAGSFAFSFIAFVMAQVKVIIRIRKVNPEMEWALAFAFEEKSA